MGGIVRTVGIGDSVPCEMVAGSVSLRTCRTVFDGQMERHHAIAASHILFCIHWRAGTLGVYGIMPSEAVTDCL